MLYQLSYSRIKQSDITDTTKLMKKTHPHANKRKNFRVELSYDGDGEGAGIIQTTTMAI